MSQLHCHGIDIHTVDAVGNNLMQDLAVLNLLGIFQKGLLLHDALSDAARCR